MGGTDTAGCKPPQVLKLYALVIFRCLRLTGPYWFTAGQIEKLKSLELKANPHRPTLFLFLKKQALAA
jgi:hypothetical protein